MKISFENEGQKFRDFMAENPDATVVLRNADGSCEVEWGTGQGQTIDGEFTVVEQPSE